MTHEICDKIKIIYVKYFNFATLNKHFFFLVKENNFTNFK